MFEQAGFGAGHAVDGAAEHGLDGEVVIGVFVVQCALDGDDLGDVGLVGGHPAADRGGELVEVFDDEGAAGVVAVGADAVEGEDEGVAELVDVAAEPKGGGVGEMGAGDELGWDGVRAEGAKRTGDGSVGTDQDAGVMEAERAQDVHGVGVAASGGNDDEDARGLGGAEGGEVARTDATVVAEQCAVHIQGNETWGYRGDGVLQGSVGAGSHPLSFSHFVPLSG